MEWEWIYYIIENENLCCISKNGIIINYDVGLKECNLIGNIDDGIKCISYNMDQTVFLNLFS